MPKRQAEESGGEDVTSPQLKKAKASKSKSSAKPKNVVTKKSGETVKDADGNPYWELGNKRRVGVSHFRGTTLVNIREYYEAPDGEMKPGKKGISLTVDQFNDLIKAVPHVIQSLRELGQEVAAGGELTPSSGGAPLQTPVKVPKKASKKTKKSNIEETSEEESDGEASSKE